MNHLIVNGLCQPLQNWPLFKKSFSTSELGCSICCSLFFAVYRDTDPTPTPPLQGRGVPTEFYPQSEAEAPPLPCRGGVGVGSVSSFYVCQGTSDWTPYYTIENAARLWAALNNGGDVQAFRHGHLAINSSGISGTRWRYNCDSITRMQILC